MKELSKELLTTYASRASLTSSASAALLSLPQFSSRAGDDSSGFDIQSAWQAAKEERNDLLILEKNILTRASPVLPQAIRLGLSHPDVSLLDYEEWFGRPVTFANPGDISSVFSPAAYLCEMYREAQQLYPKVSLYSINTRRPDLTELVLSQKNMDEEVSALSLANEILIPHVRNQLVNREVLVEDLSEERVLQALAEHVTSSGTPWHYHYARLRHAILQKDPDFRHLLAAPSATGQLSGGARAAIHFNISPALHEMLIKDITEANAESLYDKYFPNIPPEKLLTPQYLKNWFGLTDVELQKFNLIADVGKYHNKKMTTVIDGNFYLITLTDFNNNDTLKVYLLSDKKLRVEGITKFSGEEGYALCPGYTGLSPTLRWKNNRTAYGHNTPFKITMDMQDAEGASANSMFKLDGADSLRIGKWRTDGNSIDDEFHQVQWNITLVGSAHLYALKLNKAIRLYKATGISPRELEDISESVTADLTITDETLAMLSQTILLMKRYAISHNEALVMAKGFISQKPDEDGVSQWDRLFNSPPLTETNFTATSGNISLLPEKANDDADIKAVLKRAMQTDDYGLGCLTMIYHTADTSLNLPLATESISALYTLSLWARHYGLTPAELKQVLEVIGLPSNLAEENKAAWKTLLEKLDATMRWLSEYHWSLTELLLQTRPAEGIPAGPEILNFLELLREYILGAGEVAEDDRLARLVPFISGVYNLNSDRAAETILNWTSSAKPGGWTFNNLWSSFTPDDNTSAPEAVVFACALSQRVLFAKKTAVPVDALSLFVNKPRTLGPEAAAEGEAVLDLSLYTVRLVSEFSNWLRTLPAPDEALNVLLAALGSDGLNAAQVGKITGVSGVLTAQAMAMAAEQHSLVEADKIPSYAGIRTVIEWLTLSNAYDVTPDVMGQLLALDYAEGALANWDSWKQVGNSFTAGLSQSQARVASGIVQEELSAALCGFLLNSDSDFPGIKNREQLYQYLLADNLNGSQITTSRVAEAITALQTFIHRTLSAPEASDAILRDGPGRQFFLDWNLWNSHYSSWGAYRKLMYYPENYIDPTVRLGQTRMMDEMLQSLGQAQINEDTVGDAFMGYLTSFEEVANLTTLCGYHDNPDPSSGKTYFIGHNQAGTREYWWRTVDEGKRDHNSGQLPANAWTGWEKITSSLQVWNNCLRPVVYKSRLYLVWLDRQYTPVSNGNGDITDKWRWLLKISGLRYDGNWSEPVVQDVSSSIETFNVVDDKEKIKIYASAWEPTNSILVSIYIINDEEQTDKCVGWTINSDLTFTAYAKILGILELLKSQGQLITCDSQPIINKYTGKEVVANQSWSTTGKRPLDIFQMFDLSLSSATVETSPTDDKYNLNIQVRANLEQTRNAKIINEMANIFRVFPELAQITKTSTLQIMQDIDDVFRISLLATTIFNSTYPADINYFRATINDAQSLIDDTTGFITLINNTGSRFEFDVLVVALDNNHLELIGFSEAQIEMKNPVKCYVNYIVDGVTHKREFDISGDIITESLSPIEYADVINNSLISKEDIQVSIDNDVIVSGMSDWDTNHQWTGFFDLKLENILIDLWQGNSHDHTVTLSLKNWDKSNNPLTRDYTIKVSRPGGIKIPVEVHSNLENNVQYMQYGEGSEQLTRLNTLFARQLTERATTGIDTILSWETQQISEPPMIGTESTLMDFTGANGIYFWELFYYTPMMVMQRFLQEEKFELAEHWLQYVFNPGGYIENLERSNRIWNVRPLNEDSTWNDDPLQNYDPDAVAQNDPMHYKLNAFMRLLDISIGRGDAAYRKLERDTLAEAKVWYSRALNLLGVKPWIEQNAEWLNPQLGDAASETRQLEHLDTLSAMCERKVRPERLQPSGTMAGDLFSMEANDVMLGYWDMLRLRLFNLRHNLTIDGQPMNLPLYAATADPKALLSAAIAAEAGGGSTLPIINNIPALRFTPLLETARSMASQLIQFGNSMQQILQGHDSAEMSELLSRQGAELADSSLSLQKQTLNELSAERAVIERNLDAVITRRDYYYELYNENINSREQQAMNLLTASETISAGIKPLYIAGAAANVAPNIFGLANGGMEYGGPLNAVGIGMEIAVAATGIAGRRIMQEEQYRRRRQEWEIQYRTAEKERDMLQAQQAALDVRVISAQMQITQMETQTAQAKAHLALLQSQFTFKTMYSWMRSRLATIFYQYYDLTASCCLMAQKALQWEKQDTTVYLRTGTWSGAWAGLMSGEGLMLSLAQMEMAWMKYQKREMEVTRTVSLNSFFSGKLGDEVSGLPEAVRHLLNAGHGEFGTGFNKVEVNQEQLALHFSLADFALTKDFSNKNCRIRSIAVTLPALLGPYQSIRGRLRTNVSVAELPAGCNECAISHAMHDNGLFTDNFNDVRWGARWLPFEGVRVDDNSGMTLSFTDATGEQKTLLDSLSDVILHVQFTVS